MSRVLGGRVSSLGESGTEMLARIRRIVLVIVALGVALVLLPTSFTYVNPGYVGIVIHRAGGGVDKTPLGPGLHFRNPLTTGIEEYPVFMQTLVLSHSSIEGSRN